MSDTYQDTAHRYLHDPAFPAAVKTLEQIAREHGFTPGELKQIAFKAALNIEEDRSPGASKPAKSGRRSASIDNASARKDSGVARCTPRYPDNRDWVVEAVAGLPSLVRASEAAKVLRTTRRTLYRWIQSGRIKTLKRTGGDASAVLIPKAALVNYLRSLERPT